MKRPIAQILMILPVLAVLISGCAGTDKGDGIATTGKTPAPGASSVTGPANLSEEKIREHELAFAKCMREQGVEMPDPKPGEGTRMEVDGDPAKFDAALAGCNQLLPGGGAPVAADPNDQEQMLAFSKCMRESGVPQFPDPGQDGAINLDVDKLGVDPASEVFKTAQETCRKKQGLQLPENGNGGTQQ